jgi:hypothetical protein
MITIGLLVIMILSFIVFTFLERGREGEKAPDIYLSMDKEKASLFKPKTPKLDDELLHIFDDIDDSNDN